MPDPTAGTSRTRSDIIEGLVRAYDAIKPEPGMDGPHGGHIGGITRQRAALAIEAAMEFIEAEASGIGLDAAWAAAEAALPSGWEFAGVMLTDFGVWTANAFPAYSQTPSAERPYVEGVKAIGPTPLAALQALAARLSPVPVPPEETTDD